MKTSVIDYILCTFCIILVLSLSVFTTSILSVDSPYHIVIDLLVLLLAYGLYTALLLAVLRRVFSYPIGLFSMDSNEFTYWKLVTVLTDLAEKSLGPFTTVFTKAITQAALGANIGKQVAIGGVFRDLPLIYLGNCCTIGQNAVITAHIIITDDKILLKPVHIGRNAIVGINCVVLPGVTLGENAVLAPGAVAAVDTQIPANELWGGIPAKKLKNMIIHTD
jgi:acetyltransferase-like isoleucine patch superfamily enzyme